MASGRSDPRAWGETGGGKEVVDSLRDAPRHPGPVVVRRANPPAIRIDGGIAREISTRNLVNVRMILLNAAIDDDDDNGGTSQSYVPGRRCFHIESNLTACLSGVLQSP